MPESREHRFVTCDDCGQSLKTDGLNTEAHRVEDCSTIHSMRAELANVRPFRFEMSGAIIAWANLHKSCKWNPCSYECSRLHAIAGREQSLGFDAEVRTHA